MRIHYPLDDFRERDYELPRHDSRRRWHLQLFPASSRDLLREAVQERLGKIFNAWLMP